MHEFIHQTCLPEEKLIKVKKIYSRLKEDCLNSKGAQGGN